jgi:hypothetical protein
VGEQEWKIKIFILAVILELVYLLTVFRWIYPLESLVVAAILALLPYLLLRGPVNRIARKFGKTEIKQSQGNRTAPIGDSRAIQSSWDEGPGRWR